MRNSTKRAGSVNTTETLLVLPPSKVDPSQVKQETTPSMNETIELILIKQLKL
jgi:hypothetical protein